MVSKNILMVTVLAISGFWLMDSLADAWFFHSVACEPCLMGGACLHSFLLRILVCLCLAVVIAGGVGGWRQSERTTLALRKTHDRLRQEAKKGEDINQQLTLANQALRESEARYRLLADTAPEMIYVVNAEGVVQYVNALGASQFRRQPAEVMGRNLMELFPPALARQHLDRIREVVATGTSHTAEVLETFAGRQVWIDARLVPLRNAEGIITAALGISRDISDRKEAELRLQASLKEKDVLLREVHHRVKNNLQIISSLLNLQSQHVRDSQDLGLFEESCRRVRSMALIHEQLYQAPDLAHVDFATYVRQVTDELVQGYRWTRGQWRLDIARIPLAVDVAIPCGLIVNELVTNTLKYAFPESWRGPGVCEAQAPDLQVVFRPESGDQWRLSVSDNGVGLPADIELAHVKTLGLQLVSALVLQLGGTMAVERTLGTAFHIRFPKPASIEQGVGHG